MRLLARWRIYGMRARTISDADGMVAVAGEIDVKEDCPVFAVCYILSQYFYGITFKRKPRFLSSFQILFDKGTFYHCYLKRQYSIYRY